MNTERWQRVRRVFEQMLDLPESERAAYVEEACAGDEELAGQVQLLVEHHGGTDTFLEPPASERLGEALQEDLGGGTPGRRLGDYQLRCVIASGGMGTVYEATREHPTRTVALKVMRLGLQSPTALRRFQYESEILAHLRHPGIAQVYEAGTHTEGDGIDVPWFAMELVEDARPLVDYSDEQQLDTRERLELFLQVCEAVHHGHQKSVVHRDLKPNNILVDASGQVKVIDFGVARATDSDLAAPTMLTDPGHVVGTLQYMSPEQLEAGPRAPDIRSDVYSLGVVLFEMLCGRPPHALEQQPIDRAARILRELPAPVPSSVVPSVPRDLDWIVLRAVEKNPDRRYDSVRELAADVRRHLDDEPVLARAPSRTYRLRKFVRRNRLAVGAMAIVVLALLSGLITASMGWKEAVVQRRDAVRHEGRALAVNQALLGLVSMASPEQLGHDTRLVDALGGFREQVPSHFAGEPEHQVLVLTTIATVYWDLGLMEEALATCEQAQVVAQRELAPTHPEHAHALNLQGVLLQESGRIAEALEVYEESRRIYAEALGEHDPQTLAVAQNIATALPMLQQERSEAVQRMLDLDTRLRGLLGPTAAPVVINLSNLSQLYAGQGEAKRALEVMEEALQLLETRDGDDDRGYGLVHHNYARRLYEHGRYAEAATHERLALEFWRRGLGTGHDNTIKALTNLAIYATLSGELPEGETLLRELARLLEDDAPGEPPHLRSMATLSWNLILQRQFAAAEPLAERVLDHFPPDSHAFQAPFAAACKAHLRARRGDAGTSVATLRDAFERLCDVESADHWTAQAILGWLVEALIQSGQSDEAARLQPMLTLGE